VQPVSDKLRAWVIGLFVRAISHISQEQDRQNAIAWLVQSKEIVGSTRSTKEKYIALYKGINTSSVIKIVLNSVVESIKNYKNSNIPLAVKVSIPVTLLAAPYAAGQAAGIAAFGGAVGVPVLLLVFLGSAGISSIIDACTRNVDTRTYVQAILDAISRDEALRQMRADIRNGAQGKPEKPVRSNLPDDENELREKLLDMDWLGFEHHVMSFFSGGDFHNVSVTKPTSDGGVDGFARHVNGLLVVQCKRYAEHNLVGGPEVQRFIGAMQCHAAWRGYLVTTSGFTRQASKYIEQFENLVPIDMNRLVGWHRDPPNFAD